MKTLAFALFMLIMPIIGHTADFRNATWGMDKNQVIKTEGQPSVYNKGNKLGYTTTIADVSALVLYTFQEDHLIRGVYSFNAKHRTHGQYIEDFMSIDLLLAKKYGKGESLDVWHNNFYKDKPALYGQAFWLGHLQKMTRYEKEGNIIGHTLENDNGSISHMIVYSSSSKVKQLIKKKEQHDIDAL